MFFSKRARKSKLSFCSWVFSSGFQEGGRPDPGEAAGVRQGELLPTVQTPTPPLPPHSRLLKCQYPSLDAIAGARFYFHVVPPRGYWTLKQLRGATGRISLNLPTGGRRTFNLIRADKGKKKKSRGGGLRRGGDLILFSFRTRNREIPRCPWPPGNAMD